MRIPTVNFLTPIAPEPPLSNETPTQETPSDRIHSAAIPTLQDLPETPLPPPLSPFDPNFEEIFDENEIDSGDLSWLFEDPLLPDSSENHSLSPTHKVKQANKTSSYRDPLRKWSPDRITFLSKLCSSYKDIGTIIRLIQELYPDLTDHQIIHKVSRLRQINPELKPSEQEAIDNHQVHKWTPDETFELQRLMNLYPEDIKTIVSEMKAKYPYFTYNQIQKKAKSIERKNLQEASPVQTEPAQSNSCQTQHGLLWTPDKTLELQRLMELHPKEIKTIVSEMRSKYPDFTHNQIQNKIQRIKRQSSEKASSPCTTSFLAQEPWDSPHYHKWTPDETLELQRLMALYPKEIKTIAEEMKAKYPDFTYNQIQKKIQWIERQNPQEESFPSVQKKPARSNTYQPHHSHQWTHDETFELQRLMNLHPKKIKTIAEEMRAKYPDFTYNQIQKKIQWIERQNPQKKPAQSNTCQPHHSHQWEPEEITALQRLIELYPNDNEKIIEAIQKDHPHLTPSQITTQICSCRLLESLNQKKPK